MNVSAIQLVQPVEPGLPRAESLHLSGSDFLSALHSAYQGVEQTGADAARLTQQFLSGETQDLHTVAIAGQRASLQFEMLLQVRNKIVQAYQEVMRMQL